MLVYFLGNMSMVGKNSEVSKGFLVLSLLACHGGVSDTSLKAGADPGVLNSLMTL